ncbi:hypothetical protein FS837_010602 [Tulasnella sp. UAMH 9824]|nr:hypothetical protein FS837_010602 [Tulasnella sp. UAMH 9824]
MAGGKPARSRFKKQKYTGNQNPGSVGEDKHSSESNSAKKPVRGGDRKRQLQSESSTAEYSGSSRKKRVKVTPPAKQLSAAVEWTGRQSKNAEAILDHDIAKEIWSSDADPGSLPEDHEVKISRSASVPMAEIQAGSPRDLGDEASSGDGTPRSDGVRLSSPPPSLDGNKTSVAKDVNRPHPDLWISFGHIMSLEDPSSSFELRIRNDGSESRDVLVGSDPECDFIIEGKDIGNYHCRLTLEFDQGDDGTLRRRVVVRKIKTVISSPSLRTTVSVGDQMFVVEDKIVLFTGNVIRLGNGDRYVYHGPKFSRLYAKEASSLDKKGANSSVAQVQRLNDKSVFVAKEIARSRINMAQTEISVYEILGPHPRIVRFFESFFDFESGIHHLILEAGLMDLLDLASQMRPTGQDVLQIYAPKWTRQITEGIAYMHQHGITHRDIKPENILVCLDELDRLDMKIMDMGLAKQNTGPIVKPWFAGTENWTAPGPFMAYKEDLYVDCYGIGRILFFFGLRKLKNRTEPAVVKKNAG